MDIDSQDEDWETQTAHIILEVPKVAFESGCLSGLDTLKPSLKIENNLFEGTIHETVGTNLILDAEGLTEYRIFYLIKDSVNRIIRFGKLSQS